MNAGNERVEDIRKALDRGPLSSCGLNDARYIFERMELFEGLLAIATRRRQRVTAQAWRYRRRYRTNKELKVHVMKQRQELKELVHDCAWAKTADEAWGMSERCHNYLEDKQVRSKAAADRVILGALKDEEKP